MTMCYIISKDHQAAIITYELRVNKQKVTQCPFKEMFRFSGTIPLLLFLCCRMGKPQWRLCIHGRMEPRTFSVILARMDVISRAQKPSVLVLLGWINLRLQPFGTPTDQVTFLKVTRVQ